MDIANIIKNEVYVNTMSQVVFEPYQMRLISYFKKNKDDETLLVLQMPIAEAVDIFKDKMDDKSVPEIEARIN